MELLEEPWCDWPPKMGNRVRYVGLSSDIDHSRFDNETNRSRPKREAARKSEEKKASLG